ncbi:MAG TPA: hypothetical protein VIS74_03210 [Chthoniobacterales bacterium]
MATSRSLGLSGLCLLIALILTGVVVSYSSLHGKLAIPPDYDDSHSLVEGGLRLLTFQNNGLEAAWHEYLTRLPHSFLHYYFAALCMGIGGISEPVVYWANGIFLFAALLGLTSLLSSLPLLRSIPLIAAFACVPAAFNLVFDFRSECAMAALLFAGCCVLIRTIWAPPRFLISGAGITGLLFALCLGLKPAMFPYIIGMAGAGTLLWFGIGWRRQKWREIILPAAVLWLISVVPFAFHYVLNAEQIFGYILFNAFQSDFWKQGGSLYEQLTFHFAGFPGKFQLGIFAWPLLFLVLISNILAIQQRKAGDSLLRRYLFSASFLTLFAYLGVAVNSMNQNYFGMTFHFLLTASALLGLAWAATLPPGKVGTGLCWAALGLALIAWKIPVSQDYVARTRAVGGDAALMWRREAPAHLLEIVQPYWREASPPKAWVAAYGWVDGNTISWEAIRKGLPWKFWNYYENALPPEESFPSWGEILVVPEPGVMGTIDLPSVKALPQILSDIEKNPNIQQIGQITDPTGKAVRVFRRMNEISH